MRRNYMIQDVSRCIGCGICERDCPVGALSVDRATKHGTIDTDRCLVCGMCAVKCPKGALRDALGIFVRGT